MPDPLKLEYSSPQEQQQRKSTPARKAIEFLGFILYALLAFIFDSSLIGAVIRSPGMFQRHFIGYAITGAIGAFCTWRAIAAFLQFIR